MIFVAVIADGPLAGVKKSLALSGSTLMTAAKELRFTVSCGAFTETIEYHLFSVTCRKDKTDLVYRQVREDEPAEVKRH